MKEMAGKIQNDINPTTEIIKEVMLKISKMLIEINNIITSEEVYVELRDEIDSLIENLSEEIGAIACNIARAIFENSEELDILKAKTAFRRYAAFIDVGFSEEQAFKLIQSIDEKIFDMSVVNQALTNLRNDKN